MEINKIQILSTKIIDESIINTPGMYNILIDNIPFIETEEIITSIIQKRIIELSQQDITVIFTSANTVNAVKRALSTKIAWKIFCIGHKTKKSVESAFGNKNIIRTADNGENLAERIISNSSEKKMVLFCGSQRRNELPDKLKMNGIELEEIIVYKTIEKPHAITKCYDGILFFSPSGVKSFFSVNTITNKTQLFAIGNTTAKEAQSFTNLPIIEAEYPDTKNLIHQVIKHFSTIKTF